MTARNAFLILAIMALIASYAPQVVALGIGRLGLGMGKLGVADVQGSNGSAPGCTMNGIFDLTNTCNDIYFIGALK